MINIMRIDSAMINITRINDTELMINAEIIQAVEATPDTVITLTTGARYIVKEDCEEIRRRVIEYKHNILTGFAENT